ncbi:hypothetical protein NPIL_368341, partial [Nephila pilipes]
CYAAGAARVLRAAATRLAGRLCRLPAATECSGATSEAVPCAGSAMRFSVYGRGGGGLLAAYAFVAKRYAVCLCSRQPRTAKYGKVRQAA